MAESGILNTRRFGKSLLLDTIGEVFSGDKELFRGLWIYDSDYDFAKYPVLKLDMRHSLFSAEGRLRCE